MISPLNHFDKYHRQLCLRISLFLFSICSSIYLSCVTSPTNSTDENLMTWWNLSSRKELTEKIVDEFNATNPNFKIKAVLNSPNDQIENLKEAAEKGSLPDIWFNFGGSLASFYAKNSLSYNLAEYAEQNSWNDKFSKTALNLATFDGNLAGYPTCISGIGIFYRKDVFSELGLNVPKSFEEFEEVMATLKSKDYTPMVVAGKEGWHVMRLVEALIEHYAGSEEHDKLLALKTSWNTKSVIDAFTKFKEFIDKGYFPDKFEDLKGTNVKSLLYSKDAVMTPEGPWQEFNIHNDKEDPDLYGYFKFPLSKKGNRMSGFVEMIQFNATLDEKKLATAMKFVDFVYSSKSIQKYGSLIKQPVPRLDNKIPRKMTMTAQMLEDLEKYGSYTISDMKLPREVVKKLFKVQYDIATGAMTPEKAAKYMDDVLNTIYVN